jgi:hypothetical protein
VREEAPGGWDHRGFFRVGVAYLGQHSANLGAWAVFISPRPRGAFEVAKWNYPNDPQVLPWCGHVGDAAVAQ